MLEIKDFEHFRKMMKINTKVLIFRDLHILAVFSQNMVFGNRNVMKITHNIDLEDGITGFTQNQHFSVDFGRISKCVTSGSRILVGILDQPLADTEWRPFFYYNFVVIEASRQSQLELLRSSTSTRALCCVSAFG